ncbi:activating transcription factor 3 isoform X2 [Drosophila subobscura]|uniref:activating transcription factor 3 isoform X2 n=1 Tax=Drosophila subobscura TaxID=7241 RepID=UPI00155A6EE6|nr:activating transcription factor 3 isoform X2 [Drosophila subobscura]
MFNSNITAASLLSIENSGLNLGAHTPKTPEILNSLIAMTNPLDNYSFAAAAAVSAAVSASSAASTPVVSVRNFNGHPTNGQLHSQDSSHSSCSASPLDSPAGGTATMPSVQQTKSQLIKTGLKLAIQSKRKLSTCDSSSGSEQPQSKCSRRSSSMNNNSSSINNNCNNTSHSFSMNDDDEESSEDEDSETKSTPKGLTPEDEDRRRRRRERNKIAATKCRMKKRERTQNLIKESEVLDTQNVELKQQVRSLETERRKLLEMLQNHANAMSPGCLRTGGCQLPAVLLQSPAQKYLSELELEGQSSSEVNISGSLSGSGSGSGSISGSGSVSSSSSSSQRMSIPSMATFKFGSKTAAMAAAAAAAAQVQQQQQQLPNGYCKPSPSPQEFEHAGYLSSPNQQQHSSSSISNP